MPKPAVTITAKNVKLSPATLTLFMHAAQLSGEELDALLATIPQETAYAFYHLAAKLTPHFRAASEAAQDDTSALAALDRIHWLSLAAKARAAGHI